MVNFSHPKAESPELRTTGCTQGVRDKGSEAALPLISSGTRDKSFSLFPFRISTFVMWKYTVSVLQGMICDVVKLSKRCKLSKSTNGHTSGSVSQMSVQIPPEVFTDH